MLGEPSREPALAYTWGNSATLRLEAGNVPRVVEAYHRGELWDGGGSAIGGSPPARVGLHPWVLEPDLAAPEWRAKYRAIGRELAPDIEAVKAQGIEVVPVSGMLSWEVRLCPDRAGTSNPRSTAPTEDTFYNISSQIGAAGPSPVVKIVVKTEPRVLLPPHRPRVFGKEVDRKIKALAEKGLGARAIHRLLREQGIHISLSSVSKRLAEARQGRGN